jgi:hypothetical protein
MLLKDLREVANSFFKKFNDDPIDRLHYFHTVVGLAIYLLFITSKTYYGEPIQCVVNNNAEVTKYIHSMCWINGTFYSSEEDLNDIEYDKIKDKIDYYQWMTFIIIFLMLLFTIPSIIWSFLIYLNGFDLVHVTRDIVPKLYMDEYFDKDWSNTRKVIDNITDHLKLSFLKHKTTTSDYELRVNSSSQNQNEEEKLVEKQALQRHIYPNLKVKTVFPLYMSYIFIKMLYFAFTLFSFVFLRFVFNFDYFEYGWRAVYLIFKQGFYAVEKDYFPKKGFCTVKLYMKKYFNEGSYVCSLPINLFNQIFFLGFWYWQIILALITLASISYWLMFIRMENRRNYVLNCLQLDKYKNFIRSYTAAYYLEQNSTTFDLADRFFVEKTGIPLMKNFDLFFRDVCSLDLIFLIKLIELNSHKLTSRDIFNSLWDEYLDLDVMKHKSDTSTLQKRPMLHLRRPKEHYEIKNNE